MSGRNDDAPSSESVGAQFRTTRWSVVLQAGGGDQQEARAALETLCQAYWYPLHVYLRRRGCDPEEARDLTQSFFLHAIDVDLIARAR